MIQLACQIELNMLGNFFLMLFRGKHLSFPKNRVERYFKNHQTTSMEKQLGRLGAPLFVA